MEKKYTSHVGRYYKHYVLIILVLFAIIGGSAWLFVMHYKPLLSQRLKRQVYIASDSLYRVEFSAVHLNPVLGKFTLDSFHLIPDTNTYNRLRKLHQAPANLFDVFIGEFQLRHAHLLSLVISKKVNVKIVKAENPVITIYHHSDSLDENKETIQQALYNLTSGPLKKIQVSHIGLHNISLIYKNKDKPRSGDITLKNMELVFRDVKIDSATVKDPSRLLFAKDIWMHLQESQFFTSDSLYEITTKGIGFSILEEKGIIKELKVIPRYNESEFDRKFKYRHNRFAVSADSILFSGLSLDDLRKRRWHIKNLDVRNAVADIYLNRGLLIKPVEKPLPQKALRKAGPDLLIDRLDLKNVNIKYRELNPNSGRTGYVEFNRIYGNIRNITNDTLQIQKNKYCKADLHALFMDKGKLHALFDFNLADSNNAFTYKGHLDYLNAAVLNPATRPLGLVKIKSGRIHSLDYNINADDYGASGRVALKYDRLGISVLSRNAETGDLKKKGLASLAANLLVIKDNNIYDSLTIQETPIHYVRDPYRSVFNLMWKSIFTGVKKIVGIDEKTEQKIKSLKASGEKLKESKDKVESGSFFKKAKKFLKKTTRSLKGKK